jgi:hypothetical protein
MTVPLWRRTSSAPAVIGPFAASMISGALILSALPRLMTPSSAAGIRMSHSASRTGAALARDRCRRGISFTPPWRDPVPQRVDVDPVGVLQRAVAFDHVGHAAAVFLAQELAPRDSPHCQAPARSTRLPSSVPDRPAFFTSSGWRKNSLQRVLHAASRRLDPALDAAGMDRLARHAGAGVDVGGVHPVVLVGDPPPSRARWCPCRGRARSGPG